MSDTRPERFQFGKNRERFVQHVDERRITEAEQPIRSMLDRSDLDGLTFLDIGSGSGLFSVAAARLGAQARPFDYGDDSVACTNELKRRYGGQVASWPVSKGSVLVEKFMQSLGKYDVVYSWGVLHHTGNMWRAIGNATNAVTERGDLYLAIYNDQEWSSRVWYAIKRLYIRCPQFVRRLLEGDAFVRLYGLTILRDTLRGRVLYGLRNYDGVRGMSPWYDIVDWWLPV